MLVFVEMRRQIDRLFRRQWEVNFFMRDIIGALWDKAWRESEDTENVYVDRRRLMQVTRGSAGEGSENI
jgi:hypothetical protein